MDPESTVKDKTKPLSRGMRMAPLIGFAGGGCLLPLILFVICAFQGDTGGPLFWPFIAIPLGLVGMIVGLVIQVVRRGRDGARPDTSVREMGETGNDGEARR